MKFIFSVSFLLWTSFISAQEFSSGTIQFGVVVKDLEVSLQFYKDVLNMKEVGGFPINEDFAQRSGLSNGVPFNVKILKLVDYPNATQFKLVSFGQEPTHEKPNFIQDDNGVQYVTMYVTSMKPFLERINQNGVEFLGETPTKLDDGRSFVLIQDPDGTFIELIGPE